MLIKFKHVSDLCNFLFLGKAFVTVRSLKTGRHFTYKIVKPKKSTNYHPNRDNVYFVWVKTVGNRFIYLGMVKNYTSFTTTRSSRLNRCSQHFKACKYLLDVALKGNEIPADLEVYHIGRCGICGRTITNPKSLYRGIGPECYKKVGFQGAR